jgi:hypothetical protein
MSCRPAFLVVVMALAGCSEVANPSPAATLPAAPPTIAPTELAEPAPSPTPFPTPPPSPPTLAPTDGPEPTPTESPEAPAVETGCLVGTWRVENLMELATLVFLGAGGLPHDLAIGDGDLTLSFSQAGQAVFAYNQLTMTGEIDAGGTRLPLQIVVNGQGQANYAIEGDTVTFSDLAAPDLTVETSVDGQPAPVGVPPEEFEIFDPTSVTFSCNLEAAEMGLPAVGPATLVLARVDSQARSGPPGPPEAFHAPGAAEEVSGPHRLVRRVDSRSPTRAAGLLWGEGNGLRPLAQARRGILTHVGRNRIISA